MPTSHFAHLTDRALIRVAGPEAHHFLQNLITADMEAVDTKGSGAGALLTPQGKILFDFLIYKVGDAYILDAAESTAQDLLKRLTFYRLRAKVELAMLEEGTGVFASWGEPIDVSGTDVTVDDPRLAALGKRHVGKVDAILARLSETVSSSDYEVHRISNGVPEGLKDYAFSDIFPHDADLDQLNGVSFSKGCYVGQEVVSRVHHRGTARKRFVFIESATPLPEKGTAVIAVEKSIGEIGSSAQIDNSYRGLALLRLDKVHQAIENGSRLTCGDSVVTVSLPEWAGFDWPKEEPAS